MDLLIAVYYVLVCGKYLYLICSSYEWIYQFSVLCALACGNYSFLICGDWYKKVNKSTQTTEHVHRHHHYQTNTHSATLKPRFLEYILWCVLWLRCFGHPQNRWEYTMWKVFSTLHTSPYAHDHILRQVVPAQLCKNIWFICAVLFLCYTRVYHRCSLMPDAWVRRGEQWGLFQIVYTWGQTFFFLRGSSSMIFQSAQHTICKHLCMYTCTHWVGISNTPSAIDDLFQDSLFFANRWLESTSFRVL